MKEFIRIGVDPGKRYFQARGLENADGRAVTRKLASGGVSCVFRARQAVSDRHGSLRLGAPEPDEGIGRANFKRCAMRFG